jgi:hypothetical protein
MGGNEVSGHFKQHFASITEKHFKGSLCGKCVRVHGTDGGNTGKSILFKIVVSTANQIACCARLLTALSAWLTNLLSPLSRRTSAPAAAATTAWTSPCRASTPSPASPGTARR